MTSSEKGSHAELLFCAAATERGFNILVPMTGTSSTVDVWLVNIAKRPISVQVKRAWHDANRNSYGLKILRGGINARGLPDTSSYQAGDFDVLAAYLPNLDKFVLWKFEELGDRQKISYSPRLHRQPDNWELLDSVL